MTRHLGLAAARMHAVLVHRPGSDVFHVYAGPLTPSGRFVPRAARPVCSARTRRLSVVVRTGVTVHLAGRRMCARCAARMSATAHRAAQPPSNVHERKTFWEATGVDSPDLVVALAVASSVEEVHAIAHVTTLLKGFFDVSSHRRPETPGKAQGRWDFETELVRRRRELVAAERTEEERTAARAARDAEADDRERTRARRAREAQVDRARDRHRTGQYMRPHERELLDSA